MDPFHLDKIPEFHRKRNGNENVMCTKLREQAK